MKLIQFQQIPQTSSFLVLSRLRYHLPAPRATGPVPEHTFYHPPLVFPCRLKPSAVGMAPLPTVPFWLFPHYVGFAIPDTCSQTFGHRDLSLYPIAFGRRESLLPGGPSDAASLKALKSGAFYIPFQAPRGSPLFLL